MKRKNALLTVLALLLCAQVLWAALAYDTSAGAIIAADPQSVSATMSSSANGFMLFSIATSSGGDSVTQTTLTSADWNSSGSSAIVGTAFTDNTTYQMYSSQWKLVAPASGAHSASFDVSGTTDYGAAVLISFTGVDQTTPLRNTGNRTTVNDAMGSTSPSVDCTTVSGDIVVGFLAVHTASANQPTFTPAGGITTQLSQVSDNNSNGKPGVKIYVTTQTATGTTTTVSGTLGAAADFTIKCLPVVPAAASTGPHVGSLGTTGVGK